MIKSQHKEFVIKNPHSKAYNDSCILALNDKKVLCAWTEGTREGKRDFRVYTSILSNETWSDPIMICAEADKPHWNPVLFENQNGEIILYFKVGHKVPSWKTFYCTSLDGKSWNEPKELVTGDISGGRGPSKNKPIILKNGRIIAPASDERNNLYVSYADISDDCGITWKRMKNVPTHSLLKLYVPMIQPALWQSADSTVHMLTRTHRGRIYKSDSSDMGETWCMAYPIKVPNPNSPIDLDVHEDGRIFLVCNPVSKQGVNTPLYLMVSENDGKSFLKLMCLEERDGDYSYPSISVYKNTLHITYTFNNENIVYRKIELNKIK